MNTKLKLIIFGITGFLIANTYYDGKYTKMLMGWQKYYKMAMFAFSGLSLYLFIKKHPNHSKDALLTASNLVKYIPVDSDTSNLFSKFLSNTNNDNNFNNINVSPQMKRMLNSGKNSITRSVSETKKKYVAAQQGWKCKNCRNQLNHTFQVDHVIDLQFGGDNSVGNLAALCNNCHAEKTASNNL